MIVDIECPDCDGLGQVQGTTPSHRSRFVGHDDLSPDDYAVACPKCLGSGTVEYCPDDDAED